MGLLSDEDLNDLLPAETAGARTPIPVQMVSSDEYWPSPQTKGQREVQARLGELAEGLAARQGLSRRRFFQTAAGMAAAFTAMNQTYGALFEVSG
ncbi:MAG TPA: hypothetical protein VD906_11005, partial [Caulobacteraceae bacterium]|nr:hypothetical protein [Caulobacteraceae bacterium]